MRQYPAQLRKVTLKQDLDIRIQFTSRKPREILIETSIRVLLESRYFKRIMAQQVLELQF